MRATSGKSWPIVVRIILGVLVYWYTWYGVLIFILAILYLLKFITDFNHYRIDLFSQKKSIGKSSKQWCIGSIYINAKNAYLMIQRRPLRTDCLLPFYRPFYRFQLSILETTHVLKPRRIIIGPTLFKLPWSWSIVNDVSSFVCMSWTYWNASITDWPVDQSSQVKSNKVKPPGMMTRSVCQFWWSSLISGIRWHRKAPRASVCHWRQWINFAPVVHEVLIYPFSCDYNCRVSSLS